MLSKDGRLLKMPPEQIIGVMRHVEVHQAGDRTQLVLFLVLTGIIFKKNFRGDHID